MGNMYERIQHLCTERGIKPGRVCNETGLSRGLMTDLKMGRTKELSAKNTKIIADYFGVSVGYLLGTEDQKEKPLINDDEELTDYVEMLKTRPECRMLFQLSKNATKEDVEAAVRIIEALRNK